MNDALDSIIELNTAIANDDLERTKVLVDNINQNIDNLHERFGVQNNICGTMGVYETFNSFPNDSTLYAIENLKDVDSLILIELKDIIHFNKIMENNDREEASRLPNEPLTQNEYSAIQIRNITRLINFTQQYELFEELRKKVSN